ncbi:MAG TPA: LytTR family transcriptional regulator DNA-binding domain-containing protein [Vicinamibacterales bacterium]|nr:LytTR family transcriptional regulator DNA-binding domain-containing protein [Vicinamibacterales bacterium]
MQQQLTAVIVDDEAPARMVLKEYLAGHADIRLAAECANGFEAVKAVTEHHPDLLFLDVQMPKLDGFEVLELLSGALDRTAVVFATAYDEYALRAFEVHAVDYLLKPYSAERFNEALARARARLGREAPAGPPAAAAAEARRRRTLERVLIRDGAQVHVLSIDAIDYVEAQDDYVAFHAGGRSHLKEQTLADVESALDPTRFVRVHRSYIVNVERIARVELYAKDSRVAILADGSRLPVSRSGYQRLNALL